MIMLLSSITMFGYSQDWFRFNDYKADNERIIADKDYPEVVFIGNSITEIWALYHPEFFKDHNYCGRGIGGQTSAHILVRFQADVIDLHPKVVVIMVGTNDVAHNDFWVSPEQVVNNVISMWLVICIETIISNDVPIQNLIKLCSRFDGLD